MKIDLDAERTEAGRDRIEVSVGGQTFEIHEPTLDKLGELLPIEKRLGTGEAKEEDLDRLFELLFGEEAAELVKTKVRISEVQGLFERVFEWIAEERDAKKERRGHDSRDVSPEGSRNTSEATLATG